MYHNINGTKNNLRLGKGRIMFERVKRTLFEGGNKGVKQVSDNVKKLNKASNKLRNTSNLTFPLHTVQ